MHRSARNHLFFPFFTSPEGHSYRESTVVLVSKFLTANFVALGTFCKALREKVNYS
mgnify:CR=1 FL=1